MQSFERHRVSLLVEPFLRLLSALHPVLAVLGGFFFRGISLALLKGQKTLLELWNESMVVYKKFCTPSSEFSRKPAHVTFAFCEAPASKNLYRPHFDDLVLSGVAQELSLAGYAYVQKKIQRLMLDPNQPLGDRDRESALYFCLKRSHFKTALWLLSKPNMSVRTCQQVYDPHVFMTDRGPLPGCGSAMMFALTHKNHEIINALIAKGVHIKGDSELDLWAIEKMRAYTQRLPAKKALI